MKAKGTSAPLPAADPVEAVARFVSGFTHRIKSPLTGVKGYGRLVESEDDRARRRYWRQRLDGVLDSLDLMIEGMGRYRIPENINRQEIPAQKLVEQAWDLSLQVVPGVAAKRLRLRNLLPAELVLRVDPVHFRNLLVNLFQNAMDATNAGGEIRVARSSAEELLCVEDEGLGLQGVDHEWLTQPFFTTRPDRAGLGLAVAEQIATEHGLSLDWQELEPTGLRARIFENSRSIAQRSEK